MKKIISQDLPEELQLVTIESLDRGHLYKIKIKETGKENTINFQKGGRNTPNSIPGIDTQSLLNILIDRTKMFQEDFPGTNENDEVLNHLEKALSLLNERTITRSKNKVLGNSGEDYKN